MEGELYLMPTSSPWKTIWFHPRDTMRVLLDTPNSDRGAWRIAAMFAFLCALSTALGEMNETAEPLVGSTIYYALATILYMFMSLWLCGEVGAVVGSWLGGSGSAKDLRLATAWSWAPFFFLYAVDLPASAYFLASGIGPEQMLKSPLGLAVIGWALLTLVWSVGFGTATFAVAHRFGLARGFVTTVVTCLASMLSFLLIYIPPAIAHAVWG